MSEENAKTVRIWVAVVIAASLVIVAIFGVPWDETTADPVREQETTADPVREQETTADPVREQDTFDCGGGGASPSNLVPNPSFEDGDVNGNCWGLSTGGEQVVRISTDAVIGESSARVTTGPNGGGIVTRNPLHQIPILKGQIPIRNGIMYAFAAWVKAPAGVPMVLDLDEYDATDAFLRRTRVPFTGTGRWERVAGTGTVGANAARGQVRIATEGATVTTFFVDYVLVLETRRAVPDRPQTDSAR